ncbi:MAG: sulfatase-like hydrolase/transferase [Victivallaceae bacterium]|nr:sulfatase-like hydrolase/transferase [Victivallaceae bacterium]
MKRPNVIIIQWDEMRADTTSYMKHALVKTPNLDRLAACSYNFTDHHVIAPMCAPARHAFFTGKYGHCTNAVASNIPLAAGHKYWPQIMKENGYNTAAIGKLHHFPSTETYGFDFAKITDSQNSQNNAYLKWIKKLGKEALLKNAYNDPDAAVLKERGLSFRWGQNQIPAEYTETAFITNEAVDYLSQEHDKPLFMHISFKKPHSQHFAPAPWDKIYNPDDITPPEICGNSIENKPSIFKRQRQGTKGHLMKSCDWAELTARYYGLISFLDDQCGRIINVLEEKGYMENSIIIFTSDHGTALGHHGYYGKFYNFEFSTKVPLLIHLPDQNNSEEIIKTNKSIDIMPAILEQCGISVPGDLQGQNINKLITGNDVNWDESVYTEMHGIHRNKDNSNPRLLEYRKGLRLKKWKISYHVTKINEHSDWTHEWELYNYKDDPDEYHNLALNPDYSNQLDTMKNELLLAMCKYENCIDFSKYGINKKD